MRSTTFGPGAPHSRTNLGRTLARVGAAGALAATFLVYPASSPTTRPSGPPTSLTDGEFWEIFTTMSEPNGSFVSENFVSNETSFQHVIPTLQRTLTPDGVYLGVGPEQNFTYIANLRPRMAVIFDIRRQNAMQHLLYKALFELSPTRAEFVSRLFSRPDVRRLAPELAPAALFDSALAAEPNDSAFRANHAAILKNLTEQHGFALPDEDLAAIGYLYGVFFRAGPNINYGYRPNGSMFQPSYPTFGMLQSATNADSVAMAFLATETNYGVVRDLQLRNLIVPVVGDFAGPHAIRSVGEYLRKRDLTVTAFYLSNVEQYLYRQGSAASRFYGNVAALPLDSTSTFIRSVPGQGNFGSMVVRSFSTAPGGVLNSSSTYSVTILDSAGVRVTRIVQDSAGVPVTRSYYDSTGRQANRPPDSTQARLTLRADSAGRPSISPSITPWDSTIQRLRSTLMTPGRSIMMGGLLTSGIASIRETLDASFAGKLNTYQDAIAMTRTTGWK